MPNKANQSQNKANLIMQNTEYSLLEASYEAQATKPGGNRK